MTTIDFDRVLHDINRAAYKVWPDAHSHALWPYIPAWLGALTPADHPSRERDPYPVSDVEALCFLFWWDQDTPPPDGVFTGKDPGTWQAIVTVPLLPSPDPAEWLLPARAISVRHWDTYIRHARQLDPRRVCEAIAGTS